MPQTSRPARLGVHLLAALVTFQGLSGIAGGYALTVDPSGADLGLPLEWLSGTPFPDYRIPGVVLFSVLGVGPLVVGLALWGRRSWAWPGAVLVGLGLLTWILVEIALIGYKSDPPLQAAYGALALAILGLAALPSIRSRLREGPSRP